MGRSRTSNSTSNSNSSSRPVWRFWTCRCSGRRRTSALPCVCCSCCCWSCWLLTLSNPFQRLGILKSFFKNPILHQSIVGVVVLVWWFAAIFNFANWEANQYKLDLIFFAKMKDDKNWTKRFKKQYLVFLPFSYFYIESNYVLLLTLC